LFASVSSETMLPQDNMVYTNELMMFDSRDVWPRVYLPRSAFQAIMPDANADGLFDFPAGIDALSLQEQVDSINISYFSFMFSTNSNGSNYLDGDILALDQQGGLQVVYSESQLTQDLSISAGSVDVDALCARSQDELLLSFRDGLQSSSLGVISDGDIVSWNPQTGDAYIYASEVDVQAWFNNATGSSTAIGDVKSISFDRGRQALLFSVQSPSDQDATVFTSADGGSVFHELSETSWQFRIPTELDALCISPQRVIQTPILSVSVPYVQHGSYVKLRIRHAFAQANIVGACSSVYKTTLWPGASVGFSALSRNALYYRKWPSAMQPALQSDSYGSAIYRLELPLLPIAVSEALIYCQAKIDGQGLSSPLKLQISQ
ncbi:MAG: hypothetical protein OSB63_07800, partial [Planctomycetota bacterium]|nr:hypothetical protein [Planctomycetota bacterium]